jgi:hypothetical protein
VPLIQSRRRERELGTRTLVGLRLRRNQNPLTNNQQRDLKCFGGGFSAYGVLEYAGISSVALLRCAKLRPGRRFRATEPFYCGEMPFSRSATAASFKKVSCRGLFVLPRTTLMTVPTGTPEASAMLFSS